MLILIVLLKNSFTTDIAWKTLFFNIFKFTGTGYKEREPLTYFETMTIIVEHLMVDYCSHL